MSTEPVPPSMLVGGPGQPLSGEQYRAGLDFLAGVLRPVQLVSLDQLREYLEKAETLGPLLDPTAYMRGGRDNLADQRDLLDAAAAVQRALTRIRERMEARG